jgi:hypothetical protein
VYANWLRHTIRIGTDSRALDMGCGEATLPESQVLSCIIDAFLGQPLPRQATRLTPGDGHGRPPRGDRISSQSEAARLARGEESTATSAQASSGAPAGRAG